MSDDPVVLRVWVFGDLHFETPPAARVRVRPVGSAGRVKLADMLRDRNSAIRSLAEECNENQEPPDVIVALGDIGDSASPVGLRRGLEYLDSVRRLFHPPPEVMVLPGNHDIRVHSASGRSVRGSPFHPGSRAFYRQCKAFGFSTPDRPRSWPSSAAFLLCPLDATRWVGARVGGVPEGKTGKEAVKNTPVAAVPAHWAPGVLQQDMRDFVSAAVHKADPKKQRLTLGFIHQPITSHAGEAPSLDLIDGFVAGGIARRWLMENGFSALVCGHRHEAGVTLETPLQLQRDAREKSLAMLTAPAHAHPDFPVVVCDLLIGGRVRTASLRCRLARRHGPDYRLDSFCTPIRLSAPEVPVWQARLRKTVNVDKYGEAAVRILMEGLAWKGAYSPYVAENLFRLRKDLPGLAGHERVASLKFHLTWEHGAVVIEPHAQVIGEGKADAWIVWDRGKSFEEQPREDLGGKIIVATDSTAPVDVGFSCSASNAYATTYRELMWLEGRRKGDATPREYERNWQHVSRQCDLLDFEVHLPQEGASITDVSRLSVGSDDPCKSDNTRLVLDERGRRILASIRHPVPSENYELRWAYTPSGEPEAGGEVSKAETYRRTLLEIREGCRAMVLRTGGAPIRSRAAVKLVQQWISDIVENWARFTGAPSRVLDVSVMVPTLPVEVGVPFNRNFLAKVAATHKRVKKDLRDYDVPPMRLITVAGNVRSREFWDSVFFSYGEGLAGQVFRRNKVIYRDGFNPSNADRLYKPLPRRMGRHHSLLVFPVALAQGRYPVFVLNVGVLDRAPNTTVLASRLAHLSDEERAGAILDAGDRLGLSGHRLLEMLVASA